MKEKTLVLMFCFLLAAIFPLAGACADKEAASAANTFVFPSSREKIEESAFFDTAVNTIIFPDGFLWLGENAFGNAKRLTDVYIPGTAEYIAQSAFPKDAAFTIYGIGGSRAEKWAKQRRIPFVARNIWSGSAQKEAPARSYDAASASLTLTAAAGQTAMARKRDAAEAAGRCPQERPELNPLDYRFP